MSSIVLPLLAAAAALTPSNSPARHPSRLAQRSGGACATILSAARIDWSLVAAGTARDGERIVQWTDARGDLRHDLEFQ